jgi:hypothetical protein
MNNEECSLPPHHSLAEASANFCPDCQAQLAPGKLRNRVVMSRCGITFTRLHPDGERRPFLIIPIPGRKHATE